MASLLAEDEGRPILALVPHEAEALAWLEMDEVLHGGSRAVYFPVPALTPYQEQGASLSVRAQEVLAVERIGRDEVEAVVTSPRALFLRLPLLTELLRRIVRIESGDEIPPERLTSRLVDAGYRRVDLVNQTGDFSVRGGVVDLYPPGSDRPFRLDYFGDTVESIRGFDTMSQRSDEQVEGVEIPPLALFPAGQEAMESVADAVEARLPGQLGPEARERLRTLRQGIPFEGWESLLPLSREKTTDLPSLMEEVRVVGLEPETLVEEARRWSRRLEEDYHARRESLGIAIPPEELLVPMDRVLEWLDRTEIRVGGTASPEGIADFGGRSTEVLHGQLPRLPREVEGARDRGERFLLVANPDHREGLEELLRAREVPLGPAGAELVDGDLTRGFRLPGAGLTLFSEAQILPRRRRPLLFLALVMIYHVPLRV